MKIRIPLPMLGPFLRPFLENCIVVSGVLMIGLLAAIGLTRSPHKRDELVRAAANITGVLILFDIVFLLFCFMGMP